MRVEIWSDVVCPWCYIGKRRFEQALAGYEDAGDIEVVFRPYQLDPTASPGKSMPVREAYARKFGGYEEADRIMSHVSGVASGAGLDFHLERAQRANTLLAHRLLWAAEHTGGPAMQIDLKERLLQAYFIDGENVGEPETLERLALAAGLEATHIAAVLEGDLGAREVNEEIAQAADLGITAVPTFVFEGRWTVPGAQDADTFVAVFGKVRELMAKEAEQERLAATGSACDDDACGV